MKIKNLSKYAMTLTGSSVLKMIQEETIPNVDLLVRESLQNSLDAGNDNATNIIVDYIINNFNSKRLADELEEINEIIDNVYGDKTYNYIAIKDCNTKGLLGSHILQPGKDNNLYNLVYDMMTTDKSLDSGGSWGIGKSVYYRFGIGLCFFYSRTFEDGVYKSKLCGALIENEKSTNRISKNNTGIAFFGDLDNHNNSMPIYDENIIEKFLNIFNLIPFKNQQTGTIVIIPYVDLKNFLSDEEENKEYWHNDIEQSLKISIQRWYFSRINNEKFKNGKYLIPFVNNRKVELNSFFKKLQNMYNLEDETSTIIPIEHKDFSSTLGKFVYKIFTRDELVNENSVFISHNYYFGNFDDDYINRGSIFYLRKPGMVLSYSSEEFNKIIISKDEFLVGMFILNDELSYQNEVLGQYFRYTEKASHTKWSNSKLKDFPFFTKKKPYSKIRNAINAILSEKFGEKDEYVNDSSTSILKKKLGKLLLPPENFGNGASPITSSGKKKLNKEKEKIYFDGFINGFMNFKILLKLEPNSSVSFSTFISANAKYSFDNWIKLGFKLPVELSSFTIDKLKVDGKEQKMSIKVIDFTFFKDKMLSTPSENILKYEGLKDSQNNFYGVKLSNVSSKNIECLYTLIIKPLDITYNICVDTLWERGDK